MIICHIITYLLYSSLWIRCMCNKLLFIYCLRKVWSSVTIWTMEMSWPFMTLLEGEWKHVSGEKMSFFRFIYLSCFCLAMISRSQAQQGSEALPELEVSEVFSWPRTAEDNPSQLVSSCCALWVLLFIVWVLFFFYIISSSLILWLVYHLF